MEDPNEAYAVRAYRRNKDLEDRIRALEAELAIVTKDRDTLLEMAGTTIEQISERLQRARTTASETPAKYGTCPLCTGQGGAHFPTCEYSSAETTGESSTFEKSFHE